MYINYDLLVQMHEQNEKSINALNKMIDVTEESISHTDIPADDFSLVTTFLLSKFYKSLLSIRILTVSGFEEDSRALLRMLFEQILNLAYISLKPDERTKQFVEYNRVERINALDSLKRNYPDKYNNLEPEIIEKIENDYRIASNRYDRYKGWSGISIKKMADECGGLAKYWYDIIYSAESIHVHSSVSSSRNFLFEENDTTNVKVGPYPFEALDLLSKIAELSRDMLKQALKNWKIETSKVDEVWEQCRILLTEEFVNKKR